MRPFVVEEHISQVPEVPREGQKPPSHWPVALFCLALLGCAAEIVHLTARPISVAGATIQLSSWVSHPALDIELTRY